MKQTYLPLCIMVCILVLFSACSVDETIDEIAPNSSQNLTQIISYQAETFLDVSYGDHAQQTYDIYLPKNRSHLKTKVIILVHGGGWRSGDKSTLGDYITALQETNPEYAIVNMNYITAEEGTSYAFPSQFLDISKVINSVTEFRYSFQVKPEFGLVGASAGGYLVLMYDNAFDTSDDVKFVCSIAGPTNFDHPYYKDRPDFESLMNILVNPTVYPDILNNLNTLSPVYQATENSSPTIMFYGSEDVKVPISNAYQMRNSLTKNRVINSLTVFQEGHGNWNDNNRYELRNKLSRFIYRHLPL